MKSKYLLFLLFSIIAFNLFATHYRGGEITYKVTGNYAIEATVTTYTKTSYPSILADRDSITIYWGDGTNSVWPRVNGYNDGTCTGASPCGTTIGTDIRQNIYTGTHVYTGAPAGTDYYMLTFFDENLVGGISNIANGNSINVTLSFSSSVYLSGNYNVMPGGLDASPVFLNLPVYYGFVSQPYTFNSAAYDPDGDSLSYTLVVPQANLNNVVPEYIRPDSFCLQNGDALNTISIRSANRSDTLAYPLCRGLFSVCHCGKRIQVRFIYWRGSTQYAGNDFA